MTHGVVVGARRGRKERFGTGGAVRASRVATVPPVAGKAWNGHGPPQHAARVRD